MGDSWKHTPQPFDQAFGIGRDSNPSAYFNIYKQPDPTSINPLKMASFGVPSLPPDSHNPVSGTFNRSLTENETEEIKAISSTRSNHVHKEPEMEQGLHFVEEDYSSSVITSSQIDGTRIHDKIEIICSLPEGITSTHVSTRPHDSILN